MNKRNLVLLLLAAFGVCAVGGYTGARMAIAPRQPGVKWTVMTPKLVQAPGVALQKLAKDDGLPFRQRGAGSGVFKPGVEKMLFKFGIGTVALAPVIEGALPSAPPDGIKVVVLDQIDARMR